MYLALVHSFVPLIILKRCIVITFEQGVPAALLPITHAKVIPGQQIDVVAGAWIEVHQQKVSCIRARQRLSRAVNIGRVGSLKSQIIAQENAIRVVR